MNTGWHPITPTTSRWRRVRRAIPAGILATLAALTVAFRADATQGTAEIGCTGPAYLNLSRNVYGNPIDNPTETVLIGHTAFDVSTPIGSLPYDATDHVYSFQLPDDYRAGDTVWFTIEPQIHEIAHTTTIIATEQPCDTTTTTNPPETTTTNTVETTTTSDTGTPPVPSPPTTPQVSTGSTLPKTGGVVTEQTVAVALALTFIGGLAIAGTRRRHRGN